MNSSPSPLRSCGDILEKAAWAGLALAIGWAPWAYGCTRRWAWQGLSAILAVTFLVWVLGLCAQRRWPQIPWAAFLPVVWLLGQAAWMTWNAHYIHDSDFWRFVPLMSPFPQLPGSVEKYLSEDSLLRVGGLLLGFLVIVDALREDWVRRALPVWIGLNGTAFAILGLLQRFLDAPTIYWGSGFQGTTFFATYRYHGNAGAYLNLVLPACWGLMFQAWSRRNRWALVFWIPAVLVVTVACFVNASRAAAAVSAGLIALMILFFPSSRKLNVRRWLLQAVGVLFSLALAAAIFSRISPLRWALFPHDLSYGVMRWAVYKAALPMVRDAGWWGFGPGAFAPAFPAYIKQSGASLPGYFVNTHQDYLQTLIEWGILGSIAWTILTVGWVTNVFRGRNKSGIIVPIAGFGLFGVLLHALVDFPLQISSLEWYSMLWVASLWTLVFQKTES